MVIRPHRPWRDVVGAGFALVLVGVAVSLAHQAGEHAGRLERARSAGEIERLQAANRRLESSNALLRERAAILERAGQIEEKAYADVDQHLKQLQDEVLDLKEEVAFYRGIVSSGPGGGLSIQSFDIQRDGDDGEYSYRLVLTGDMKNDKVITGTVNLSVAGERQGRLTELSLADLSARDAPGISFQLKYFQKIRGRITLPEDFVPHRVFVQVTASGKSPAKVEKTFDWPTPMG